MLFFFPLFKVILLSVWCLKKNVRWIMVARFKKKKKNLRTYLIKFEFQMISK